MFAQTTHITLLARLSGDHDPAAWREFHARYGELIRAFARHQGLQAADCDDVLQDVLMALTKAMPGFTYDPGRGKFRSYLKTVTLHAIFARSRQKGREVALEEVGAAVDASQQELIDRTWDEQWRQYHLKQAMRVIEAEHNEVDRAAFQRYAVEGQAVQKAAAELGISVDQVYQAKSRILKRLGQLIAQQVEEEG